jgi:hypothetical protein
VKDPRSCHDLAFFHFLPLPPTSATRGLRCQLGPARQKIPRMLVSVIENIAFFGFVLPKS